jgi:hypothetical protein
MALSGTRTLNLEVERHLGRLTDQLHWPIWRRRPHSRPPRQRIRDTWYGGFGPTARSSSGSQAETWAGSSSTML